MRKREVRPLMRWLKIVLVVVSLAILLRTNTSIAVTPNSALVAGDGRALLTDITFRGTALERVCFLDLPCYWRVFVSEVLSGPSISGEVPVFVETFTPPCLGDEDSQISPGDVVEVRGLFQDGPIVSICESNTYYIVKFAGQEVKFRGRATSRECGITCWWTVYVEEVISGPSITGPVAVHPSSDYKPCYGFEDPNVDVGDQVEVYGMYYSDGDGYVDLCDSSAYYIVEISDTSPPSITNIHESDDPIDKQGCPLPNTATISARVTDDMSGVDLVKLVSWMPSGESYQPLMDRVPGTDIYQATIGPFSSPGTVTYFIIAKDNAGNESTTDDYHVTVNDCPESTYSISGLVTDADGNLISDVILSDDAGHSVTTDSNGDYILSGLAAGTYVIAPSKSGYTFSPASRTVSVPPSTTGQDFTGTSTSTDPDMALAIRYAPFLWLHSEDPYDPNPISVMLDNATLRRRYLTGDEILAHPPLNPVFLGGFASDRYYMDLHYAPYDYAGAHRNHYENNVKESNKVAKAYTRVCRNATHTVVQYWLFYYYNNWEIETVIGNLEIEGRHEGDWEMVQVVLEGTGSNPIPIYVAYSQHRGGSKRLWSYAEKISDHPVIYVAKGSHASYFKANPRYLASGLRDTTERGRLIPLASETRLELLACDASPMDPPWLQFAGRWGEVFSGCALSFQCGPRGPGHQGDKWGNSYGWSNDVAWDELSSHYLATTRFRLPLCQLVSPYLVDTQGRRIGPGVNRIDPTGRSAEYIRNCDPGGAGRQTILIHDPGVEVSRIDLLPDVTAIGEASEVRIQQTQVITLEVNLPDYANNRVTQATYADVTVGISTTGSISVTAGGDLVLELDNDGDGITDQTVTPALEETEQDFTAPTAVSDLAVTDVITGAVTLSWAAPGDDGVTGTAASYDIRYYTAPITAASWVSATLVVSPTVPATAGTTQTMTVSDLPSGTLYFAVRAIDEVGNVGNISNSPGATIIGYPEGDFDRSCLVDVADIQAVAGYWRTRIGDTRYDLAYDLNQDAYINIVDIMRVVAAWDSTCH